MLGDEGVVAALNDALTAELTAVNQYFIASKMAANWGFAKLAKMYYDESLDEMKHAEVLIERILMLEGTPNMQRLSPVEVGESVVEQFRLNHAMETAAVARYRAASALCTSVGDAGTRAFIDGLLASEEAHVDEVETELANLELLGEGLWLNKWV
jgi:bacterioferritin